VCHYADVRVLNVQWVALDKRAERTGVPRLTNQGRERVAFARHHLESRREFSLHDKQPSICSGTVVVRNGSNQTFAAAQTALDAL
jgi:hypothetical protein